jgi:signal transduction histidine kinase
LQRSENALRTAKETVERTSRGKSEFLANLSHELRTPLNAIVGFAEIFESEAYGPLGNARYRDYSGHIHRSARHMLDLVNDTLDLSRAEVGRLDLIESEISVGQTIETCARMLSRQAEQAGIAISQSVEPALPRLRSDERRVRQIFLNLLSNAIKFTPSGGRVEVGARRHADGGMVVTVADSGIGIAEGDVEKALTPFTRLESGRLHHYEGAGIGLSLTRFLVELHGGQLTIDSEVGLGTRVSLHFPPSRTGG